MEFHNVYTINNKYTLNYQSVIKGDTSRVVAIEHATQYYLKDHLGNTTATIAGRQIEHRHELHSRASNVLLSLLHGARRPRPVSALVRVSAKYGVQHVRRSFQTSSY